MTDRDLETTTDNQSTRHVEELAASSEVTHDDTEIREEEAATDSQPETTENNSEILPSTSGQSELISSKETSNCSEKNSDLLTSYSHNLTAANNQSQEPSSNKCSTEDPANYMSPKDVRPYVKAGPRKKKFQKYSTHIDTH